MQPFKMSKDARYKRLLSAVKKADASAVCLTMEEIPREYWQVMAVKVAQWAIEHNQVDCLKVSLLPRWGHSTVDSMVDSGHNTLLHWLVYISHQKTFDGKPLDTEKLLAVLLAANARMEDPSHGDNPLSMAIKNNDVRMAGCLLDAGADPTGLYRYQKSPGSAGHHHWPAFCMAANIPMVEFLLDKGVPYTHATPGDPVGGIAALLMNWPKEDEIPALVQAWLNRGGDVHAELESPYGPGMSLSDYAFDRAMELNEEPRGPGQEARHEHRRQRLFRIQEALVLAGCSLETQASSGKTWGELVEEKGSPRLLVKVRLERHATPASPAPRVRM